MRRYVLLLILLAGWNGGLFAQFYDQGVSPASVRWRQIRTPYLRMIYPEESRGQAIRVLHYLDTIRTQVAYGYAYGPLKIPVVMHTQNFASNGLVMWAPKRMELITAPAIETHAEPWLKQLSAHEYRHAVQYANLNRGVIRGLSYVLGDQGSLIGTAFMPLWFLEGDAVMAETEMSTFGRGLQPSFTLTYRALSGETRDFLASGRNDASRMPGRDYRRAIRDGQPTDRWRRFAHDKWFCGSYRDYIPNHYNIGYQIASYSYDKFGRNIGDDIARYIAHRPYYLAVTHTALRHGYDTSVNDLFRETWSDLDRFWGGRPARKNSTRIIPTPWTSHVTYTSPVALDDTTVIALKSDLATYSRIVAVDPRTGDERTIRHTGSVSTPPVLRDGRVWWTEYRTSTLWEQRVNSQLCYLDLARDTRGRLHGRRGVSRGDRQALHPAPMPDGVTATVRYNRDGSYSITADGKRLDLPDSISVHGLAWDDHTRKLYFIGLSDCGMWIGAIGPEALIPDGKPIPAADFTVVKPAAYSTLSGLRAAGGKLYYTSIQSGRDEGHMFDPATGREWRITDSRYGSFAPTPTPDGSRIVATTYTPRGYQLAEQANDPDSYTEVTDPHPLNLENPPRRRWPAMNLDTIRVGGAADTPFPEKRFRKWQNLFAVHSWAPAAYDPIGIVGEQNFNVRVGATVMSQSLLSDMIAMLNYAWTEHGSQLTGRINYRGWAPKIELEAVYGGGNQIVYLPREEDVVLPGGGTVVLPSVPRRRDWYFEGTARIYLPLRLAAGYHVRSLTPQVELSHINALLWDPASNTLDRGMQKLSLTLQYTDNVRLAARDFLPRWGYAARIGFASNPFNDNFGTLLTGFVRTYLPGVAPHHSLTLRAAAQRQYHGFYYFSQKDVFPRGADYNFTAMRYLGTAADYQFPLCYPDGGITSILYFKRIRLNLTADYARFETINGGMGSIFSYGGQMIFDLNFLRGPAASTTAVSIGIFKPDNQNNVTFSAGVTLPL